jgi:putative two-component system response regulator
MSQAAASLPVILVVDDAEDIRNLAVAILSKDAQVKTAPDGRAGLEAAAAAQRPDLILLDVDMPGANGFEVCKALKANPATASIPVLFLTARGEEKYEAHGFAVGATDYITKPINTVLLRARVRTHLGLVSKRHELEALVRERSAALDNAKLQVIRRLARAMEYHENASAGNRVLRVVQYARLLAEASGARPDVVGLVMKAAPLYDIGKVAIPNEILSKQGPLTAPDWEQVRRHPEHGAAIIGEQSDPIMQIALAMALTHHERWNGKGYPKGIAGEQIPWPGRLMAIVDTFEAMTTNQFHRRALSIEQAVTEIVKGAGTLYDPKLVDAFEKALPAMRKVREAITDTLGVRIDIDPFEGPRAAPAASAAKPVPKAPSAQPPKPQAIPPKPQAVPPKPQAVPPKSQAVPPKPQAVPPKSQAVPPKPQAIPPKPQAVQAKPQAAQAKPAPAQPPKPGNARKH